MSSGSEFKGEQWRKTENRMQIKAKKGSEDLNFVSVHLRNEAEWIYIDEIFGFKVILGLKNVHNFP